MPSARRATAADHAALTRALARAFADDPVARWACPPAGARPRMLARCDEDGVGAYLESSKERNVAFYARHGFRVTRELRLPRGPRVWAMWRDPR